MTGDKIGKFTVLTTLELGTTKCVLAENRANEITPYATWEANTSDPNNYYTGHYFATKTEAATDFAERVQRIAERVEYFKKHTVDRKDLEALRSRGLCHEALEETFSEAELFGKTVLFTKNHIHRSTLPEGVYAYDVRHHEGYVGAPKEICRGGVMSDFYGTVICNEEYKFPRSGSVLLDDEDAFYFAEDFADSIDGTIWLDEYMRGFSALDLSHQAIDEVDYCRTDRERTLAGYIGTMHGTMDATGDQMEQRWDWGAASMRNTQFDDEINRFVRVLRHDMLPDPKIVRYYCDAATSPNATHFVRIPEQYTQPGDEVYVMKYATDQFEYVVRLYPENLECVQIDCYNLSMRESIKKMLGKNDLFAELATDLGLDEPEME